MKNLHKKLVIVATIAVSFLLVQLIAYLYSINELKNDLITLEKIHDFMEDVLELRRYEKNFAFKIDKQDIDEVLKYIAKIKTGIKSLSSSPAAKQYEGSIVIFEQTLIEYEKLAKDAKSGKKLYLDKMRHYGKLVVDFSQKALDANREYIAKSIKKIMFIPSTAMFLFGGSLIIALLFLISATIKQINFINETTQRIAKGDFSYIDTDKEGYTPYSLIIDAFNVMIAELEYHQKELLQSKKLAAVGLLTSGIAHEVNNPLNNIILTADSILEEYDDLDKEEKMEMLDDIVNEVRRASRVVQNLLDFSKSNSEIAFELLDIREVIKASLKLTRNQIMLSGIQLRTEFPDEPLNIMGDMDTLKQMFINLFLNALHAMPGGGILAISVKANKDESILVVEISDTGIGIEPDVVDKIFDPFFTTKPVGKGTGLGLSVVYGIVKKHEGYIEVKSTKGKGTTFFVHFPYIQENL